MPNVLDQDFVAAHYPPLPPVLEPYVISGHIRPIGTTNIPVHHIPISLFGYKYRSVTFTDANGYYRLSGIDNGSYLLYPYMPGGSIGPNLLLLTIDNDNMVVDFTITAIWQISGNVKDNLGVNLASVTITYSGEKDGLALTNASGNYTLTAMPYGFYIVTPSRVGYTFDPPNRFFPIYSSHVNNQDFIGTPI